MRQRKYTYTQLDIMEKWANKYPSVLSWLQKLNGTKAHRAVRLSYFCLWSERSPEELLELKKDPGCLEAEKLLDRFALESPYPVSMTWTTVLAVKSFFKKNYRQLQSECGKLDYVPVSDHGMPTLVERLEVYRSCFNQRDRALIGVIFTSGLALETLSKLKWNHFEEDWQRQDFPHISLPPEVLKGHGKGKYKGVRQETFLTSLVKAELVKYREWMTRRNGVAWEDEMNVFLTICRNSKIGDYVPLTWNGLACLVKDISQRANVKFSIHDGRRILETALENAGCCRNWVQKIKGRKVRGEDAPYSRPAVEQLRSKYRDAVGELEFLSPSSRNVGLDSLSEEEVHWLKELLGKMKEGKIVVSG